MSKPKLYGMAGSRAFRSIWAIEEIGVDYDHVPTSFQEDSKAADYLAVNPNGRIPALVDGDIKLFESMAINMYLAKAYGENLLPADLGGEAKTWQWSIWGISEIEPLQMQIVIQKLADKRDQSVIDRATKGLQRPLKVLDEHLAEQDYLLGSEFSLADLNLAGVMDLFNMIELDVSQWGHVRRWLDACYARPSYANGKAVGA